MAVLVTYSGLGEGPDYKEHVVGQTQEDWWLAASNFTVYTC